MISGLQGEETNHDGASASVQGRSNRRYRRPKIGRRRAVRGSQERIARAWQAMQWQFKLVAVWIIVVDHIFYHIIQWLWPVDSIERALDIDVFNNGAGIGKPGISAASLPLRGDQGSKK